MAITDHVTHTFTKYLETKRETIFKNQKKNRRLAIVLTGGSVVLGLGLFWYGAALLPVGLFYSAKSWREKKKYFKMDLEISQTKQALRRAENDNERVAIVEDYLGSHNLSGHVPQLEKWLTSIKAELASQLILQQTQLQAKLVEEELKSYRQKQQQTQTPIPQEPSPLPYKTLGQRRAEDAEKKRLEEEAKNLNRVSTDDLRKKVKVETPISEMERLNQKQEQLKKNNASPEEIDKVRNEKTNLAQQQLDSLMFGDRVKSSRQTKENPLEKPSQKSQP